MKWKALNLTFCSKIIQSSEKTVQIHVHGIPAQTYFFRSHSKSLRVPDHTPRFWYSPPPCLDLSMPLECFSSYWETLTVYIKSPKCIHSSRPNINTTLLSQMKKPSLLLNNHIILFSSYSPTTSFFLVGLSFNYDITDTQHY